MLTDIYFLEFFHKKKNKEENYKPLFNNPGFIWTIKKDWYDLDHKYFRDHGDSVFYRIFQHVKDFPDYMEYYPKGAVQGKVDYITGFYLNTPADLDREYVYLNEEQMERFIEDAVGKIVDDLKRNGLMG